MGRFFMIVHEDREVRNRLKAMLQSNFQIIPAGSGKEAILLISKFYSKLAGVLLAENLVDISGEKMLQMLDKKNFTKKFPVIMMTEEEHGVPTKDYFIYGASGEVYLESEEKNFRFQVLECVNGFHHVLEAQEQTEKFQKQLLASEKQFTEFNDRLLDTISSILEYHNTDNKTHARRVKGLTTILAKTYQGMYPEENLSDEMIRMIASAAVIHDIGKICVPEKILNKPDRLSEEDRTILMSHTTKGCDVLKNLESIQKSESYQITREVVRYHHERADGRGYPEHLKGDEIPLAARIVGLADAYDNLVSSRIYKKAYSNTQAFDMILNGDCGAFDEKLIEAFWNAREAMERYSDANVVG